MQQYVNVRHDFYDLIIKIHAKTDRHENIFTVLGYFGSQLLVMFYEYHKSWFYDQLLKKYTRIYKLFFKTVK